LEEGVDGDVYRARDDAHKDDATSNHPPEDNNNENKNINNKVAVVNINCTSCLLLIFISSQWN
jgi:hypothetical protein